MINPYMICYPRAAAWLTSGTLVDLSHVDRAASLDDLVRCIGVDNIADQGRFSTLWPCVRNRCSTADRVVIFGSFFTVAEAMALFNADNPTEDARGIVDS